MAVILNPDQMLSDEIWRLLGFADNGYTSQALWQHRIRNPSFPLPIGRVKGGRNVFSRHAVLAWCRAHRPDVVCDSAEYLSARQAAEYLGITRQTLYKNARGSYPQPIARTNKGHLWSRAEIEVLMSLRWGPSNRKSLADCGVALGRTRERVRQWSAMPGFPSPQDANGHPVVKTKYKRVFYDCREVQDWYKRRQRAAAERCPRRCTPQTLNTYRRAAVTALTRVLRHADEYGLNPGQITELRIAAAILGELPAAHEKKTVKFGDPD